LAKVLIDRESRAGNELAMWHSS